MNLAKKLTLGLCGGVLVVHAGATGYRMYHENKLFEADVGRDARVLGRALAYAAERAWETGGEAEVNALAEYTTGRKPHTTVRLVWPARTEGPGTPLAEPRVLGRFADGEPVTIVRDTPDEELLTYVPVEFPGGRLAALEITDPLRFERNYLRQSLLTAVATMFGLVLLCAAVAWLLVARLVRDPLRLLTLQARGVAEGDLKQRVPVSHDELGPLAIEMNRMCERLQEASERADAEAAARAIATERLRHADRLATIGTLASSVAHELGTPINVVKGHALLITESGVTAKVNDHVDVINEQCSRMAAIIRQWLDFARRGRERGQTCEVRAVLDDTMKMLSPIARAANVTLSLSGTQSPLSAAVGAKALQQVLLNLAINAIQAMPGGGRLEFTAETTVRTAAVSESHVRIAVSDSGTGIDSQLTPRVFEPFFTTKVTTEGTGLGLPIACGIVQDCGGRLELAGSSTSGTTFHVYLPPG
jgi:two-component system, NtrC family, sensor kinase